MSKQEIFDKFIEILYASPIFYDLFVIFTFEFLQESNIFA